MDIFEADQANPPSLRVSENRKQIHRVVLVIAQQTSLMSFGLAMDAFRMVNLMPCSHRLEVLRASEDGQPVMHQDGRFAVEGGPELLGTADLVVIPSMWTHGADAVAKNPRLIAALRDLPRSIIAVALCSGAYMLAATGRMAHKRLTTHWLLADGLQAAYLDVRVEPSHNITEEDGLICSGGSLAAVDACLRAVQLLTDRRTARALADILVTDMLRGPQTRFVSPGMKRHKDREIRILQDRLEAAYQQGMSLEEMAQAIHVSVRTLQRRFQTATGMTPLQYVQALRIERAKELLETERLPVQEVSAMVGYQDRVAFGRLFKKMVGVTPAAYRQRYQ